LLQIIVTLLSTNARQVNDRAEQHNILKILQCMLNLFLWNWKRFFRFSQYV